MPNLLHFYWLDGAKSLRLRGGGGGEGGKDPDARYGQFEFIYHNVCVGRKYSLNI